MQREFDSIYGAVNETRFGSGLAKGISSMWLQVVKQAGEVARSVRKERMDALLNELPQLFCWYCAFCTKLGLSIEAIVWHYFPLICPTCYNERCDCGPHKERESGLHPRQKELGLLADFRNTNNGRRPRTLDEYVAMFWRIYGGHNEAAHMGGVFLHLMEELGEVAKWIHVLKKLEPGEQKRLINGEMASELADVFSWICKLTARADVEYQGFRGYLERMTEKNPGPVVNAIRLSELVGTIYRFGCPECRLNRCSADCPGWTNSTAN